uniref:glycerol-3-phosphate dehydrogenase n=1 Tax=Salarias fasciatus TaxID=181472 RepID=A0A672HT16_SALFA
MCFRPFYFRWLSTGSAEGVFKPLFFPNPQLFFLSSFQNWDLQTICGLRDGSNSSPLSDLKTAPVQRDDFSSGTSSRSTELIHGGVRYLQKAIMKLDYKQVNCVSHVVCPVMDWWPVLRVSCLHHRLGVTHIPLLWSCPPAAGQHDDARMNLAIALTAARYGAAIANYTEVVHLVKRADPQTGKKRVCGAHCGDVITGQEFDVRAKCVINATGPFTDARWKMDDQKNPDICQPSAGVHIVIPGYYSRELSLWPQQAGSAWQLRNEQEQVFRTVTASRKLFVEI